MKLPTKALDLGCGEGRYALYLAGLGFETSASDISESGIKKLNSVAAELYLDVDAIVCDGCLHLIKRDEWQK